MIYVLFFILFFPATVLFMIFKAHHDTIDYHTVQDKKIQTEFNVFFISDLHRRKLSHETLASIDKKIDIIIIGGDLTEKGVPLERTRANILKLKKWNVPIYFVWGNNDYEAVPERLYQLLLNENVIVLANSNTSITINEYIICLIGLDCYYYSEARMDLAMAGAIGNYTILLTHSPTAFYELDDKSLETIDIVLSGHTHGGQIRFLGLGLYDKGEFTSSRGTNILVSEGYGYTRLPFRLGTKSECHVLTFIGG